MNAFLVLFAAIIQNGFNVAIAGTSLLSWLEVGAWILTLEPSLRKALAASHPFIARMIEALEATQSPELVAKETHRFAVDGWTDDEVRGWWERAG